MNKIDELIEKLCPNGVEYKKFKDIANYIRGVTYNKYDEVKKGNNGYKLLRANNITLESNTINFDDVKIIDFSVKVKDSQLLKKNDILICAGSGSKAHIGKVAYIFEDMNYTFGGFMGVIRVNKQLITPRYLFHIMTSPIFKNHLEKVLKTSTINNINSDTWVDFKIPVPPLEIQSEIVYILDKFTALLAELKAELKARKKQYAYYRDKLFEFDDEIKVPLSAICEIKRGGNFQKKNFVATGVPAIHYGKIYTYYGLYTDKTLNFINEEVAQKQKFAKPNDIIMAVTSENVEDVCKCVVWEGKELVAVSGHSIIISHNQNARYLAYYFTSSHFQSQKEKCCFGTKVIEIKLEHFSKILVPIPNIEEQNRIVEILDKFYTITNSLTEGIPAEIEARQKQYEYYRDKLLAFKELVIDK